VVGEDVGEGLVILIGGEGGEIHARGLERSVSGGEHCEWTVALESFEEAGLNDGVYERVMSTCGLGVCWYILSLIRRYIKR